MPNYDWTLIIDPLMEEEQARTQLTQASSVIQEEGGVVQNQELLGKRELPSMVAKRREAYLARIEATLNQERVESVAKKLKEQTPILRFMTTIKHAYQAMPQKRRSLHRTVVKQPAQPREKMDVQEIDKKIEEFLEKPQA